MGVEGTPRGTDYRRKLHLAERRKLVNARDVEGEPLLVAPRDDVSRGSEIHEFVRTMQRELSATEGFIGLSLLGSATRGHMAADSDIDTMLFVDETVSPNVAARTLKRFDIETNEMRRTGIISRKVDRSMANLQPDAIKKLLNKSSAELDADPEARFMYWGVANLCGLAVGPRVEEYRKMIGVMIGDLPEERRRFWIDHLAAYALELEHNSDKKRKERIEGYDARNEKKRDLARFDLWRKKIATSLGFSVRQ